MKPGVEQYTSARGNRIYRIPLSLYVLPSIRESVVFSGVWNASIATILIGVGIVIGVVIYLFGKITKTRQAERFVGGEILEHYPQMRLSGINFYKVAQG